MIRGRVSAILPSWSSLQHWLHMITGICWMGSSFQFMLIDGHSDLMPPNNITVMTPGERRVLAGWLDRL